MNVAKIGEVARPGSVCTESRYGLFRFFENDDPIGRSLAQYGEWAAYEIQLLCMFVGLGSAVIDVGAHVGTHTVAFAKRVGPTGSVFSFEPQQAAFTLLQHNVAIQKHTNVHVVHAGVGSAEGEMTVPLIDYIGHANVGAARLLAVEDCQQGDRIPIVTLDGYNLSACHLVKIDVEGMEAEVLAGMAVTIDRLRPVVAVECNSVNDGVGVFRANKWQDYSSFLYRVSAFNPDNFKKDSHNFLGVAHEFGLLFVPNECIALIPKSKPECELIPITDMEFLAIAILEAPRFGDHTVNDRSPSRLRDMITQIEHKNTEQLHLMHARVQTAEADLKEAVDAAGRDVARLEFRAASLTQQLRRAEEQLAAAKASADERLRRAEEQLAAAKASADERLRRAEEQLAAVETSAEERDAALRLIAARDQEIQAMRTSTSWRITAALRMVKTALASHGH